MSELGGSPSPGKGFCLVPSKIVGRSKGIVWEEMHTRESLLPEAQNSCGKATLRLEQNVEANVEAKMYYLLEANVYF